MEDQNKGEAAFSGDEASIIVKECVDVILGGVDYDENRINEWMSAVVEQSLTHLVKMGKAFKYIGKLSAIKRFWSQCSCNFCTVMTYVLIFPPKFTVGHSVLHNSCVSLQGI
ncbi:hypothetical protein XENTR_v10005481 [Xenopus tropicalis]|nr:hypothetical protein XENTR_v10005481 [Xenopus tropicalis]